MNIEILDEKIENFYVTCNFDGIKNMIESGEIDVNVEFPNGRNLLTKLLKIAGENNVALIDLEFTKYLIDKGIDLNKVETETNNSALSFACQNLACQKNGLVHVSKLNHIEKFEKLLIKSGADTYVNGKSVFDKVLFSDPALTIMKCLDEDPKNFDVVVPLRYFDNEKDMLQCFLNVIKNKLKILEPTEENMDYAKNITNLIKETIETKTKEVVAMLDEELKKQEFKNEIEDMFDEIKY